MLWEARTFVHIDTQLGYQYLKPVCWARCNTCKRNLNVMLTQVHVHKPSIWAGKKESQNFTF